MFFLGVLFLLSCVASSPPRPDSSVVTVDEWGVVVFSGTDATIAGAPGPDGELLMGSEPFRLLQVDAPVVWIHGPQLDSAVFSVKTKTGRLTNTFPAPDSAGPFSVTWNLSATPPEECGTLPQLSVPSEAPFGWAMPLWQTIPCIQLYSADSGAYLSNFLYYEAAVSDWAVNIDVLDGKTLAGIYASEGLLVTEGESPRVEMIQLVPLPDSSELSLRQNTPLSDEEVCSVISDWDGNRLTPQEISALWSTWKPFFISDKSVPEPVSWILFPLPWDVVEQISHINLELPGHATTEVRYNRLFLGLVRL